MTRRAPAESRASPKVSVVVITYNHASFVRDAISSILDQDFQGDWEVIVADDCSTDGTLDLLRKMESEHARLVVVSGPQNLGAQRNLRRALRAARGEYVAFLEGDDYWTDSSKLSRQVEVLDHASSLSAAGHVTTVRDSRFGDSQAVVTEYSAAGSLDLYDVLAGRGPHFSSLMFRRALLPETPIWLDDLIAADWPILCLLAQKGEIGVLPFEMSEYRVNENSVWSFLSPVEKGLDGLKRMSALRRHGGLSRAALKEPTRNRYSLVFGGLARAGASRESARLLGDAFLVDPLSFFPQLGMWVAAQAQRRLRPVG